LPYEGLKIPGGIIGIIGINGINGKEQDVTSSVT
jgi:hypothetical protein